MCRITKPCLENECAENKIRTQMKLRRCRRCVCARAHASLSQSNNLANFSRAWLCVCVLGPNKVDDITFIEDCLFIIMLNANCFWLCSMIYVQA